MQRNIISNLHLAGCGRTPLEDTQSSLFLVLLDLTLIPMLCTGKTSLYVPFTGTSCYIRNQTEKSDVPTTPRGFDS